MRNEPTVTSPAGSAPTRTDVRSRPEPIPALTGLRIVGAAWVVVFHMQPTLYQSWSGMKIFEPILATGDNGVPLFFLLSGYIIWHNYGRRDLLAVRASTRFIWRRFARLWPVNVVTQLAAIPLIWWAVNVVGYWGAPVPDWYSFTGWLQSAFMLSSIASPEPVFAFNQPAWTLTGEMIAYVVFPLILLVVLATRADRARLGWLYLLLGFAVAYYARAPYGSYPFRWMVDLIMLFAAGVLIRLAGRPKRLLPVVGAIQVLAPVAILVACYTPGGGLFITLLLAVWVWSLGAPTGPVVWFFSTRPLQIAGQSSYSVYMTHWVVFGYGSLFLIYNPWVAENRLMPVYVIVILLVVAIASWALWKWFESPAREWMNALFERLWPKRRTGAAVEPHAESVPSGSEESETSRAPAAL